MRRGRRWHAHALDVLVSFKASITYYFVWKAPLRCDASLTGRASKTKDTAPIKQEFPPRAQGMIGMFSKPFIAVSFTFAQMPSRRISRLHDMPPPIAIASGLYRWSRLAISTTVSAPAPLSSGKVPSRIPPSAASTMRCEWYAALIMARVSHFPGKAFAKIPSCIRLPLKRQRGKRGFPFRSIGRLRPSLGPTQFRRRLWPLPVVRRSE